MPRPQDELQRCSSIPGRIENSAVVKGARIVYGHAVDVRNGYKYTKRWARKLERELVELLDAPAAARPGTDRAEAAVTEPLWQFETGG